MPNLHENTKTFLIDIKANNERQWFEANKPRYEAARADFISFIGILLHEIEKFDASLMTDRCHCLAEVRLFTQCRKRFLARRELDGILIDPQLDGQHDDQQIDSVLTTQRLPVQ